MHHFSIGDVHFGDDRTVIVAEAGVNHLGRLDYAEELVKTAARAGADIVKFQTYKAEKLTTKAAPRFWDWEGERDAEGSQYDSYSVLDSFEEEQYRDLMRMCEKYEIEFMSTPFDNDAVDMLVEIGVRGFKLASCDLNNLPFLRHVAAKQLPILLSTGAGTIEEIRTAVDTINGQGNHDVCIMHCTLCYPTEPQDANLTALQHIGREFPDHLLGLSDHTLGTIVPAASILYGARVIEKHYTFDKTLPDSADHWLSLDEEALNRLVTDVRELEAALGHGVKETLDCEQRTRANARRSVVAARPIAAGQVLTEADLALKRPGTGLPPATVDDLFGRTATRDLETDALLSMDDVD